MVANNRPSPTSRQRTNDLPRTIHNHFRMRLNQGQVQFLLNEGRLLPDLEEVIVKLGKCESKFLHSRKHASIYKNQFLLRRSLFVQFMDVRRNICAERKLRWRKKWQPSLGRAEPVDEQLFLSPFIALRVKSFIGIGRLWQLFAGSPVNRKARDWPTRTIHKWDWSASVRTT